MRLRYGSFIVVGTVLLLGACSSSSKSPYVAPTTAPTSVPSTNVSPPTSTSPGSTSPGTVTPATATVQVGSFKGQQILTNSAGMTLYVFGSDTPNKSACTGSCATVWPPLMASGTVTAGSGLSASMFSTITRDDGSMQVAVNGHPLYLFQSDTKPGDATGQGSNGFNVVSTSGTAITG